MERNDYKENSNNNINTKSEMKWKWRVKNKYPTHETIEHKKKSNKKKLTHWNGPNNNSIEISKKCRLSRLDKILKHCKENRPGT